jgi:integrase
VGVDELPSGRWRARVQIDGRSHSALFDSAADARDWLVVTRARSITGKLPGRTSVHDYGARWILQYDHGPKATRRFHESNLRLHIYPRIGPKPLADVTVSDVSMLLNAVRDQVSAAKADSVYRTLSALCTAAQQDDVITLSPVRSKKHRPRRQKTHMPVLERDQARLVLLQLQGWCRDMALLQLALGARFGEIAGLTPHDIASGHVDIVRRVSTVGGEVLVGATKNHRRRTLELPTVTLPTVERLVREACEPEPIGDLQDRELPAERFRRRWLVQTATGRPANLARFNAALKDAVAAVGIPPRNAIRSSHGLRHSYVSWMIDDGHGGDKIAFWIGDTTETVRRVYAHMLEASSSPAARSVDAALGHIG